MFGIGEIAIILIVVILVVGAKKLPELARSAGKSARIFKAEARAMKNTDADNTTEPAPRVISGETLPLEFDRWLRTSKGRWFACLVEEPIACRRRPDGGTSSCGARA
ncbi:twin-arginine translocase TatA/TatE family subunit [Streptomyces sp. NBC_01221]|uniref:twin-arginine translocase TatA/TatE family subunit n=1 Tax=Streptomyces sp. NBC_01221 TaxID=2903782 RepID=UPI00224FA6BD|nr:twin-arginine translocase TatA/TatE family subunit [Streptomyces sp. NBC_01221]MCX4787699.1 twin-arginine translocase TatA/TatE family subunit [Streptomyces sp. NBC_01221]